MFYANIAETSIDDFYKGFIKEKFSINKYFTEGNENMRVCKN